MPTGGCSDPPTPSRETQTQAATEPLNLASQGKANGFEGKLNKLLGQPILKYTEDHRFYAETLVQLKDLEPSSSSEEDSINKVIELFELLGGSDKEKIRTAQGQLELEIDGRDGPQTMAAAGRFLKESLGSLKASDGDSLIGIASPEEGADEPYPIEADYKGSPSEGVTDATVAYFLLGALLLLIALNAWTAFAVTKNRKKDRRTYLSSLEKLITNLDSVFNVSNLTNEISQLRRENQENNVQILNKISEKNAQTLNKVSEISKRFENVQSVTPEPPSRQTIRYEDSAIGQLVSLFNRNSRSFNEALKSLRYQSVSESNESAARRRREPGYTDVILESTNIGDFWIVEIEGSSYLFPTQGTIGLGLAAIARAVFQGFQAEGTHFELVQPAKVSATGRNWKLGKQGELRHTNQA